jgi:hypothetical protein
MKRSMVKTKPKQRQWRNCTPKYSGKATLTTFNSWTYHPRSVHRIQLLRVWPPNPFDYTESGAVVESIVIGDEEQLMQHMPALVFHPLAVGPHLELQAVGPGVEVTICTRGNIVKVEVGWLE